MKTFWIAFFLLTFNLAEAADRYANPSGSGTTCSSGTPCDLATAVSQALAGETVWLQDGTYAGGVASVRDGTAGNPITIRAVNRRQATVNWANSGVGVALRITHSYITIRGLVLNSEVSAGVVVSGNTPAAIRVLPASGTTISNFIVEDNQMIGWGGGCIQVSGTSTNRNTTDGIIRFNDCINTQVESGTDVGHFGEGFYIGAAGGTSTTANFQIYGNTITDPLFEAIDIKPGGSGHEVHHNVINGSGRLTDDGSALASGSLLPNTGAIQFGSGSNHSVHNNIVKNSRIAPGNGIITADGAGSNNRFGPSNVVRDSLSPTSAAVGGNTSSGSSLEVDFNTWCDLNTYATENAGGFDIHDNNTLTSPGAATSACDSEEARILAEIAALPGNPSTTTGIVLRVMNL